MPEKISVNIPIKPVLKKYLQKKAFHISQSGPLRFHDRHPYNILLIKLVVNYNRIHSIPISDKENVISHFRPNNQCFHSIEIQLPSNSKKNILFHNYLSVAAKQKFRKFIWSDFIDEFILFLHSKLKLNVPRNKICIEFMEKYDLTEDDIKTESLYRLTTHLLDVYAITPKHNKKSNIFSH
jgi:hypothetical protein